MSDTQAYQAKQLILLCQKQGDYQKGLTIARQALILGEHQAFFLSAAATMCIRLEYWQEAIDYALQAIKIDSSDINSFDVLAHAYGAMQDWGNAAPYGRAALELRHLNVLQNTSIPTLPPLPDGNNKRKNIISFSLFGDSSAYIEPAIMNVALVADVYPDWICRFYVDESVPSSAVDRLTTSCSEVVHVQGKDRSLPKTMWRFLAMDDKTVGRVIFRDADSVISGREATTVAEWIDSGQRFHTIRDSGSHTELVLAGLWGALAGMIPNITQKMHDYIVKHGDEGRFADQNFLREVAWRYIHQDVYASDRIFGFMNAKPILDAHFDFSLTHIGCNEGSSVFCANSDQFTTGKKVTWRLYSSIRLLPDFTLPVQVGEERLICEYHTVAKDGHVKGLIPRRYAHGIDKGLSRIELITT